MAQSQFFHAKISGIHTVAPKDVIRLEDELQYFKGDIKKAQRMTKIVGMDCRRVAQPGVTPSDLSRQAAELLFKKMEVDPASVDTIIFLSQRPDHILPATACILQKKLGLSKNCAAFDVNQGCSGYVYGLWLAFSLIESRAATRVLLLVGDGMCQTLDSDNRVVAPVFGDAGSATIVEYSEAETHSWFSLGADGGGAEALMIPAGAYRLPLPKTVEDYAAYCEYLRDPNGTPWRLTNIYMDGGAIFDFTVNTVPPHILETLAWAGQTPEDIDWFVPHQANKQIMSMIAQATGFSEQKTIMSAFSKYGNTAAASIPTALCDAWQEIERSKKSRLMLCGFGVGLSWASAILDMGNIICTGVTDFDPPADSMTQQEYLAHWQNKITGKETNLTPKEES
ncbi:MAG: ketoacyl-ACP synthase III [Desulfovibrio sp.]|uniref:3-oxoacyl-ACP synthase III family protein n=1 Tax=Desulfovibrio sp. TaxID=885 RepID=UPI0039E6D0EA